MAAQKNVGSILPASPHPPIQSSSVPRGMPWEGFHPIGKIRAGEPQQVSPPWIWEEPHSLHQHSSQLTEMTGVHATATPPWGWSCHCSETYPQWPQLLICPALWNQEATELYHLWDWSCCCCSTSHVQVPSHCFDPPLIGMSCHLWAKTIYFCRTYHTQQATQTKFINLLEENTGINLYYLGFCNGFSYMTPKAQGTK